MKKCMMGMGEKTRKTKSNEIKEKIPRLAAFPSIARIKDFVKKSFFRKFLKSWTEKKNCLSCIFICWMKIIYIYIIFIQRMNMQLKQFSTNEYAT